MAHILMKLFLLTVITWIAIFLGSFVYPVIYPWLWPFHIIHYGHTNRIKIFVTIFKLEKNAMTDLKKMCRVCMAEASVLLKLDEITEFTDKLSEDLKNCNEPEVSPGFLLQECSGGPVESGEFFPQVMCELCIKKLRQAYLFKRRYKRSMETLKMMKTEADDHEVCDFLESEDWELIDRVQKENEESEEIKKVEQSQEVEIKLDEDLEEEFIEEPKKAFKCPYCPRSFTLKAHLTSHRRTHNKTPRKNPTRVRRRPVKD